MPTTEQFGTINRTVDPRLMRAKFNAAKVWPFARFAIMSMIPVKTRAVPTLAVDKYWRLYYNPDFIETLDDDDFTTVIIHELYHLLLKHSKRAELILGDSPTPKQHKLWNVACDLAVNRLIENERGRSLKFACATYIGINWLLPNRADYSSIVGYENYDQNAEFFYRKLTEGEPDGEDYEWPTGYRPDTEGNTGEDPPTGGGIHGEDDSPEHDSERDDLDGVGSGGNDGESGETGGSDRDTDDSDGDSSEDCSGDSQRESSSDASDGHSPEPDAASDSGSGSVNRATIPSECKPGCGFNGSSADGLAREWELDAPSVEENIPGIEEHYQEAIITEVAAEIQKAGIGTGNWKGWADMVHDIRIDPKRMLLRKVKDLCEQTTGIGERTYRKPSRRPSFSGIIQPSNVTTTPRIVCCLDTSASMYEEDFAKCLGMINKIYSSFRMRNGISVVMGDTEVKDVSVVKPPLKGHEILGGGGTDVGVLLDAARNVGRKPHVIVALTDGITPWPDEDIGVPVIAVITREESSLYGDVPPEWIDTIYI